MLQEGLFYISSQVVGTEHTAVAVGSGDLNVLSTPSMVALMENAAMLAVANHLSSDQTTVGGYMQTSHLKPTKVGERIEAKATLVKIEGKKLFFDIEAKADEILIGKGQHIRFIVDKNKFI